MSDQVEIVAVQVEPLADLLDLIVKVPFGGGPFVIVDVFGLLASAIVIYLGWNASRDLK